ncbi:hypothetical protein [Umboniibacter marinipuniceus]|uniref:1-aminocyclopropane-1-carboxylate deaminase/D-cysteine desulfhydrase-like pyridoxal-dependent ACC family enzyme n=1 Tax=Umboniibacter marinipuniceus TaxID=569599 RepID=A0A3M0AEE2_9GAMM|nr:hypothetical protein [Umboniibacter marinipuniceus]RMA81128.1 1-aminocyclopropane-1-carboxylate deaminase/D-cysteine desulfhydrase-like pyridoxal-dependent ACC family enzyme [Umboniibacter marinipuniceus]
MSLTHLKEALDKKLLVRAYTQNGCRFEVAHLDAIDLQWGGNKLYKLIGFLADLSPGDTLVSFGGEHSNHLYALAALADEFRLVVYIRKSFHSRPHAESSVLALLAQRGVECRFLSSEDYQRARNDEAFRQSLGTLHGAACIIPEGGNGAKAEIGLRHLAHQLNQQFEMPTEFHLAAGTGTTARGLAEHLDDRHQLVVTPVVTPNQLGFDDLPKAKLVWYQPRKRFAKLKLADQQRLAACAEISLKLDRVYTIHALETLLNSQFNGAKCLIHTGGMRSQSANL